MAKARRVKRAILNRGNLIFRVASVAQRAPRKAVMLNLREKASADTNSNKIRENDNL